MEMMNTSRILNRTTEAAKSCRNLNQGLTQEGVKLKSRATTKLRKRKLMRHSTQIGVPTMRSQAVNLVNQLSNLEKMVEVMRKEDFLVLLQSRFFSLMIK